MLKSIRVEFLTKNPELVSENSLIDRVDGDNKISRAKL